MPAFFQPTDSIDTPTSDLLSWMLDNPKYDVNKPIFISANDPSRTLTSAQSRSLIRQLAKGLKDAGLKPGECVLLHSFNDINYPIVVLGVIAAGGIWTGSNPSYTTAELTHHIAKSSARFIISEPEILGAVREAGNAFAIPEENYWVFDSLPEQTVPKGYRSWRTLLERGECDWVRFTDAETARTTTCMRLFSSGTTGLPKAANLSHANFIAQHTVVNDSKPRFHTPSFCLALPMFHAAAVPAAHITMLRSGYLALILRRFDLALYLHTMKKYKITEGTLVPPIILALVMSPQATPDHFSAIICTLCGAAPLSLDLQRRFEQKLPKEATCTQVWGMTETSCVASKMDPGEKDDTGSVGYLVPGLEAKLLDDKGSEIREYGKPGEMCVRGITVFQGYHMNEQTNRESFDEEGFYKTGDIMYCDEKTKKWYIVDRKKELIKVRGFQVAPAELEGVVLSHPHVADAAVIGIGAIDAASGTETELPRAYVVKRPGSELSEKEVYEYCAARLAGYKRLEGGVVFIDVVPKNAAGKIIKNVLRQMAKKEVMARL